ncbi:class I SAM-dependent methyltransferase [Halobacillus litoralis]|uniref:class I SAM-dependent DNA methyltransferase n=1 Tax=Halobacillus litoralis TaxID=45668 RepID=UPI001CD34E81|nr:class I SAM-dependent methyltransferase [Halobacillus litoralis]MCA0971839.1 class I SAM-dependent methyltransferase [Halobacillus litoralis]
MGIEFVDLFDQWASSYDETVSGHDPEYREVFEGYEEMLQQLADLSISPVMEFGVGTANLTRKIIDQHKVVFGIEPSKEMRRIANVKCPEAAIYSGDFLQYPSLMTPVSSIVSSFAFHHLTKEEKEQAIERFFHQLEPNGQVVFIDTLFKNETHKQQLIMEAEKQGFLNLAQDLQEEYYPYLEELKEMFLQQGFEVSCKQLNKYAWLIQAKKGE